MNSGTCYQTKHHIQNSRRRHLLFFLLLIESNFRLIVASGISFDIFLTDTHINRGEDLMIKQHFKIK